MAKTDQQNFAPVAHAVRLPARSPAPVPVETQSTGPVAGRVNNTGSGPSKSGTIIASHCRCSSQRIEDRAAFRRLGPDRLPPLEVPHRQWMDPGGNTAPQAAQAKIDILMRGAAVMPGEAAQCLEPAAIDGQERGGDAGDGARAGGDRPASGPGWAIVFNWIGATRRGRSCGRGNHDRLLIEIISAMRERAIRLIQHAAEQPRLRRPAPRPAGRNDAPPNRDRAAERPDP